MGSELEEVLAFQIRSAGLPEPKREYLFGEAIGRRWKFDFAWPDADKMLAVECEGGVWSGGRHTRGKGFTEDCSKYNSAMLMGWRLLRVTSDMIASGEALQLIERALGGGMYYILDGKTPTMVPMAKWAKWFESADRVVKQTNIGEDIRVSTVFLGLNHQWGKGPPLLFETLVFGGEHDGDMWRYSTWQEAEAGHLVAIAKCAEPPA